MAMINSAAPKVIPLGINDKSTRARKVPVESRPSHLPKVFLFTKKGPTTEQLVGEGASQLYGAESFDLRKPWATHQTAVSLACSAAGNAQMITRMVPADAPLKSNLTLWLDVLQTDIPVYLRNADGSYQRDEVTGEPLQDGNTTVPGYRVRWSLTHTTAGLATDADSTLFGDKVSEPGTVQELGKQSTKYPILEMWADSFGSYGDNCGLRLWAPKESDSSPVNSILMNKVKAYPFRMAMISRKDAAFTAQIVPMVSGDMAMDFVFPDNIINPDTDGDVSLMKKLQTAWQSLGVPGFEDIRADLSGVHLYKQNLATIMALFYDKEVDHLPNVTDFNSAATDEMWMFNLLTGTSSTGAPYSTYVIDSASIKFSESTNLWASGGGDGTMGDDALATLVSDYMLQYANRNSRLMNDALHVESIIYDSGFPLQTKKDLCQFLAIRKDTFVVLSTYTVGGAELTHTDEAATATALKAALSLYPESTYFGTGVVRGMIIGRYGDWLQFNYKDKLPLTMEILSKGARFMGAGNGVWKIDKLFDRAPNSIVENFANINVTFVPADQRNKDWANGLNYPQQFNRSSFFFPAIKTIYGEDTSVLTSFFTAMVCVEAQKIGNQVWREFTGSISLTEAQLIEKVNARIEELMANRFAGLFVIKPVTTITESDAANGYSWTTAIKVYANNMKTVMTLSVEAYRMSDLAA